MKHLFAAVAVLCASSAFATESDTAPTREEFAALKAEVAELRALVPTQAHVMADVEYQFANVWFAARARNWPLASFYVNETRSRINWALRIRPVRKLANGEDIVLAPYAQNIERVGLDPLKAAVEAQDLNATQTAYRATLAACHACHIAVEKPQLATGIPRQAASPLIRIRPATP